MPDGVGVRSIISARRGARPCGARRVSPRARRAGRGAAGRERGHPRAPGIHRQPAVAAFRALLRGDGWFSRSARPLVAAHDRRAGARIRRAGHLPERTAAAPLPALQPAQRTCASQPDRTSHSSSMGTVARLSRRARARATNRAAGRGAFPHRVKGEPLRGVRAKTMRIRVPRARVQHRLVRPRRVRESRAQRGGHGLPRRRLPRPARVSRG